MAVLAPPKKKAAKKPLTLAQIQSVEAGRVADLSLTPAKQSVTDAVAAAELARVNRIRATEGVTRALSDMTSGDAEQIRAAYADSASRLGAYGTAFTGDMRARQEAGAASANDIIKRLAIGPQVTTDAVQNANVAAQVGVNIPGGAILAQAPAALAQALSHRTAAGARLADNAGLEDYKAGVDVANLRKEILNLESKRPGLVMEALDHIHQQANAKRATDTQIGYLQLQQAKTVWDRAIAMTNLNGTIHVVVGKGKNAHIVDTGRPASGSDAAISETRAATARANAATAAAAKTAVAATNAAAKKEAARIAADAKVDAANVAQARKANKPIPASTVSSITGRAHTVGTKTLDSLLNKIWGNIPEAASKQSGESSKDYAARQVIAQKKYHDRLTQNWGTAMAQVVNAISPHLRVLGYTPAQIKSAARQIVAAEITPPTGG